MIQEQLLDEVVTRGLFPRSSSGHRVAIVIIIVVVAKNLDDIFWISMIGVDTVGGELPLERGVS